MKKEEYIESLNEIVNDKIYITTEVNNIEEEISINGWGISVNQEMSSQLIIEDIQNVLNKIKENRRRQVESSNLNIGMVFYLWFDEQSSQLKFNLINKNHNQFPFKCQINIVDDSTLIIDSWLRFNYHNGIPIDELSEETRNLPFKEKNKEDEFYVLDLYKEEILINKDKILKEYKIYIGNKLIGTSSLEKADAPMGVVFGKINSAFKLDYQYLKNLCELNNIALATEFKEDKYIATRTIENLKVVNDNGIEIKGIGNQISGMDSEGFEISIEGIPYPFYNQEFPHHRKAYDEMFKE